MATKKISKTAMLREKFGLSTDDTLQQGSIEINPKPPANEFNGSTIVVSTNKPCPQTPATQIGLQRGEPESRGKAQKKEWMLKGPESPVPSLLKSPLQFLTPEEKKSDQPKLSNPENEENTKTREVSRLLKDALSLIRQAARLQPNLNTLAREVEKAQDAPLTYEPSGKQESYKDILLKDMKKGAKVPMMAPQNTLVLKVDKLEVLDPQQARDKINKSLGAKRVAAVRRSTKGNLIIKTTPNTTPRDIQMALTQVEKAIGTNIISAEEPKEWHKLVAHGVPALLLDDFQNEVAEYNDIAVAGNPRWLCPVKEGKKAGSVVFSVATEAEKRLCLSYGLNLFGRKLVIEAYRPWNGRTQCFRCQGFGHDPKTCRRKIACGICNKNHFSRSHRCRQCNATTECEHIQLREACVNCKGDHHSRDQRCPILKAHRGPLTTTSI